MSIESKHAYRFGYLKSDQWKNVRLEALVREKGCCQICGDESISNDAHHIWYPERLQDTEEHHLVILCRCCHDFVHSMLPDCKTKDQEEGRKQWSKFKNAVIAWRISKEKLFRNVDDIEAKPVKAAHLRSAYDSLKIRCLELQTAIEHFKATGEWLDTSPSKTPKPESIESTLNAMFKNIKKWAESFKASELRSQGKLDDSSESR